MATCKENLQVESVCPYCHTDRDGYVQMLPREGIGNVCVTWSPFGGWILDFSGKYHTRAKIKIKFCPMCGRELKRGVI